VSVRREDVDNESRKEANKSVLRLCFPAGKGWTELSAAHTYDAGWPSTHPAAENFGRVAYCGILCNQNQKTNGSISLPQNICIERWSLCGVLKLPDNFKP
jgi:hypothetical protein